MVVRCSVGSNVASMVHRAVTTCFTAAGDCPETQKLLENPLLPQNKTSNFDKAFDAECQFTAGVDF